MNNDLPHDPQHAALSLAVKKAGSQSALARRLGISQNAVSKWLRERRALPAQHVLPVEAATGVSRYRLRPDLYPREQPADDRDDRFEGTPA